MKNAVPDEFENGKVGTVCDLRKALAAWHPYPSLIIDADFRITHRNSGWDRSVFSELEGDVCSLPDLLISLNEKGWATPEAHVTQEFDPMLQAIEMRASTDPKLLNPSKVGHIVRVVWSEIQRKEISLLVFVHEAINADRTEKPDKWFPHRIVIEQTPDLYGFSRGEPLGNAFSDPAFIGLFSFDGLSLLYCDKDDSYNGLESEIANICDLGICLKGLEEALQEQDTFVQFVNGPLGSKRTIVSARRFKIHKHGLSFLACRVDYLNTFVDQKVVARVFPQLTPREAEISTLLAMGKNLKEIAQTVDRAQGTVTVQARSAMQKLQVRSTIGLAILICKTCASAG